MEEKILATVGDIQITEREIRAAVNKYPADQRGYLASPQGQAQLLEQRIAFILFTKEALDKNWDKEEEYQKRIAEVQQEIFAQMYLQDLFESLDATEEELKAFYDENKENFREGVTANCSHILMDTEDEIKDVKEQLEKGEITFAEAAQKYSKCPSKAEGGNLGPVKPGMMVPEFDKEVFSMPLKTISDPIKTQFGYHLLWVEDRSEDRIREFDEVKDELNHYVLDQKKQDAYESRIIDLREKYGVKQF